MGEIIKEKEEIQEFLKNLGIEYRFSCYSEKNPEGCQLLADYLAQIDKNYEKSNIVLKENCNERHFGRSCTTYGQNLLIGKGCGKNAPNALSYFEKGCEYNDVAGCDSAGKILSGFGSAVSKKCPFDPHKGLKYLLHGCNIQSSSQLFESSESCYTAAFMLSSGIKNVLEKDYNKALELGTKACKEMDHMNACKLVSKIYEKLNNEKMANEFIKLYNTKKRHITDNLGIEMQRT